MNSLSSQSQIDETHDPGRRSWVEGANRADTEFPIQNLPLGIFEHSSRRDPRIGIAIGDSVLDLEAARESGQLSPAFTDTSYRTDTLDGVVGLPVLERGQLRREVAALLDHDNFESRNLLEPAALLPQQECNLLRPTSVPGFVDFYAGIEHAKRAGEIARPGVGLARNYHYQPVGYHGRAQTVVVSGSRISRPVGSFLPSHEHDPTLAPTACLDFELELAGITGGPPGKLSSLNDARDRLAGLCILNDWSARDIQRWEMAPMGPFLGKSFATTISPWVVTTEALAPFRRPLHDRPADAPAALQHLEDEHERTNGGYDIELSVAVSTSRMRDLCLPPHTLVSVNARDLYWSFAQLLRHYAIAGCVILPGEVLGSGTISGPLPEQSGSLFELTVDGKAPVTLPSGEQRTYLQDRDRILFHAVCRSPGCKSIGFGVCVGEIMRAG